MAIVNVRAIGRALDAVLPADEAASQAAATAARDAELRSKLASAAEGWGANAVARVREKGKWPTWERLSALLDADRPFFPLGSLVNWGRAFAGSPRQAPGAGLVTGIGTIDGRHVVVVANDNTVASGSWWPLSAEKIERAQEVALALHLPVIYLVDCSGLFLPEQSRSFAGRTGAGAIFARNAQLAAAGVPQIAAVFGDCIAGGGYMPIISDRVAMTESAYVVIAGAALIRGAKSLKLTSLDIGGPEVHVHQSRVADVRVPDDPAALAWVREEVGKLPTSAVPFHRGGWEVDVPARGADELGALMPVDPRASYDVMEVIARLVDGSLFHEFLPGIGREIVTGVARVSGLWCGFVANRQGLVEEPGIGHRPGGALYREGIAKISTFARACGEDGIPLFWLQDISGFDIGVEAERQGLLGFGSSLIYTNATQTAPQFAILLRKASGAGYYAMAGHPYTPVLQLATTSTRLAVMEGRTLAIAAYNTKLDDDFEIAATDPAEREAIARGMAETAARIEADMDPVAAASRMDCDEVVPLDQLRSWLVVLAECAWQTTGTRRVRNSRIWSLHDAEVLGRGVAMGGGRRDAVRDGDRLTSPSVGMWQPAVGVGARIAVGTRLGTLTTAGVVFDVAAPVGTRGQVAVVADAGWVDAAMAVVELGVLADGAAEASADAVAEVNGDVVVSAETDGTVWLRPKPDAAALAPVGAAVAAGAQLALIEVMKTFAPARSPVAGVVTAVLVEDGTGVTAGQGLFRVRANG